MLAVNLTEQERNGGGQLEAADKNSYSSFPKVMSMEFTLFLRLNENLMSLTDAGRKTGDWKKF